MCTDEREVSEYWHSINAALDLDIKVNLFFDAKCRLAPRHLTPNPCAPRHASRTQVLDDVEAEAAEVVEYNPWLTYGEALHRAREFGVCVLDTVPSVCALSGPS
jgi:hypothetical protein